MRLGEWLVHNGVMTPEQVQTALWHHARWKYKFGEAVLDLKMVPPDKFLRLLAGHLNVPFIRSEQIDKVPASVVQMVPPEVLARLFILPLKHQPGASRGSLYVATHQPENLAFIDEVSFATGFHVVPVLALRDDIERALRRQGIIAGRHIEPIELPPEEDFRLDVTR